MQQNFGWLKITPNGSYFVLPVTKISLNLILPTMRDTLQEVVCGSINTKHAKKIAEKKLPIKCIGKIGEIQSSFS